MRAIVVRELGGPEVLRVEEVETPRPGPGQVLLRVAAAGINYADLAQRKGTYLRQGELPFTPGMEAAGVVEAVGPGVERPAVGSRVAAFVSGGYAEYALAGAATCVPLPEGLGEVEALALFVQGITAYQILADSGRLAAGESVLVNAAAGGVGSLAVQIARLLGAGKVIGAAGGPEKAALARDLGADTGVDYRAEDWIERVLDASPERRGVDLALEMVGGEISMQTLRCLAPLTGRMVVYGAASGERATFSAGDLMDRNLTVTGYWLGPRTQQQPAEIGRVLGILAAWVASGELRVVVGGTYRLDEAAEAHRAMAERRTTGKIALVP